MSKKQTMKKFSAWRWIALLLLITGAAISLAGQVYAREPALVLTAFGTSTAAADTYRHLEDQVKARFPGHQIRWAFTSEKVRRKVAREQGQELTDLP